MCNWAEKYMRFKKEGEGLLFRPSLQLDAGTQIMSDAQYYFLHPFITPEQGNQSREKVRVGILR